MVKPALVSVIMPAFNAAEFIISAVKSVQNQTYAHWELLIIEDASTDFTLSKIKQLVKEDSRIKLLENYQNEGSGISRNKGIKAASGDFIAFLDADDLWKPEKLKIQLDFMHQNNVDVCYSSYELISENGKEKKQKVECLPFLTYQKLLKSNYIGNLTGVYNARKLGKIYCPEVRKRQDWALWLNAVEKAGIARGIQDVLAIYRKRKKSLSGNKLQMLKYNFNIYHKVLGFGLWKSSSYMMVFLKEHFLVKTKQIKTLN